MAVDSNAGHTPSSFSIKSASFSRSQLTLFALMFAIIGGIIIYKSFASAPVVASIEAERMTATAAPTTTTTFSTSLTKGATITTPYLWTFNPAVSTKAGYFFADGHLLKKINGPGPYAFRLTGSVLSAGSHQLGHAWDTTDGQHKTPSSAYGVTAANSNGTGFVTTLSSGLSITPPYTWAFDPGTSTTAGYFFADGRLLQKITGAGPYALTINPSLLTAGSHQLGHAWDTSSGQHLTPTSGYGVIINNTSTQPATNYSVISDTTASGGQAMKFGGGVSINGTVNLPSAVTSVTVVAHGEQCSGAWPQMNVAIDGQSVISAGVSSTAWSSYSANISLTTGSHTLIITNSSTGSCQPNLFADTTYLYGPVVVTPPPTVSLSVSPSTVTAGSSASITWASTNATSCTASGAWSGSPGLSGSQSTGALNQNSTYSLTCTGSAGTATSSATVTVSAQTPPVGQSCTKVLLSTDSIINAYNAAHAGDVICLAAGVTYNVSEIDFHNSIGSSSAPITITSVDVTRPSTILGRIVTYPGANNISLTHLNLDGKCPLSNCIGPTVGSDHFSLQHDDITNENTAICVHLIADSTYGTAHYTLIDQNRIHNCGRLPAGSTNNDHGIYDIGYYATITNNFIYDNTDRGIQLRGAHGDIVRNNVSDGNGEGIIFGELGATNNNVYNNIFSNSIVRYNIESYWGGSTPGTGNTLYDSCVWTTRTDSYAQNNSIQSGISGVTLTNVKFADPQYTNRAAKDFTLQSGSPCAGYGVQSGIHPGV